MGPQRIGKYELECELGRGAFGRVFRARDPDVRRPVAVKILAIENEPDLLARFQAEANAAGNLQHKNIVTVYEYGESRGIPFIAMEYLEGETLQAIIARAAEVPLATKMRLMSEIADGLHYAHQRGVVHRDVKPSNIVVLPSGGVKIVDFGIARLIQNPLQCPIAPAEYLAGTPRYLSPEQCEGIEADALSDMFAYGIVYYELLTGRHPFEAESPIATLYKIRCADPEPLSSIPEPYAAPLTAIVGRALAKERHARYATLEELKLDAEPLRLELERQRTQDLLVDAESQAGAGHFEQAKSLVHEVLLFDPSNRHARQLRTRLRQLEQEQDLRARMNTLVRDGEQSLRERRHDEAVERFKEALACDPADEDVKLRLDRAVAAREQQQQLAGLKKEARQERERGELTVAWQVAGKARQLDPGDDEVLALLDDIQRAMEAAAVGKRRREQLDRAKGLLLVNEIEAAEAELKHLAGGNCPESEEMLARIAALKAERQRRFQLKEELAGVRNLLGRFCFEEALPWLDSLVAEWPEEEEPRKLRDYARHEAERQRLARALEDAKRRAKSALAHGDFDSAIGLLEHACKDHPDSAELMQLLKAAGDQRAAVMREQAFKDARERIARLREQGLLAEAIRLAELSRQRWGENQDWIDLAHELGQEWEAQRRRDAVRKALESARGLLDGGQARTAISLLKRLSAENPGDAAIAELLKQAERLWVHQQRDAAIEKVTSQAKDLAEAGEHDRALKLVLAAIEENPIEPRLDDLLRFLEQSKAEAERARNVRRCLRQCERFRHEGRFEEAFELVCKLIAEQGESPDLIAERDHIDQELERRRMQEREREPERQQRGVAEALATARELEQRGQSRDALQVLELAALRYPNAPEVGRAQSEVAQRREVLNKAVQSALTLLGQGQPRAAISLLESLSAANPETEIVQLLQRLKQTRGNSPKQSPIKDPQPPDGEPK